MYYCVLMHTVVRIYANYHPAIQPNSREDAANPQAQHF